MPYIIKSIKQLESAKADFIVLPCNTLHSLLGELREESKTKIVDLIEEVSKRIKKDYKKVGILCTTKTKKEGLYNRCLKETKIIYPDEKEQKEVSNIILRIIRKKANKNDREYLNCLIKKMINQGVDKVILACTDLANLITTPYTLDSTQILVESMIDKMKK